MTPRSPLTLGRDADLLLVQTPVRPGFAEMIQAAKARGKDIRYFPAVSFSAFHPNLIFGAHNGTTVQSPLVNNNSAITLFSWMNGLSVEHTLSLFREDVFTVIGYFDHWTLSQDLFVDAGAKAGFDLAGAMKALAGKGCFMHCTIHPRLIVMAEIARALLDSFGIEAAVRYPENYLPDDMVKNIVRPVYPPIAERLGVSGEYIFKLPDGKRTPGQVLATYDLPQFVERSFAIYAGLDPTNVRSGRFKDPTFLTLARFLSGGSAKRVSNPYKTLPDTSFWRRAVTNVAPGEVDPVVSPRFRIALDKAVATAGSCFAQHIARRLANSGHRFLVTETGDHLPETARTDRNYGVYSARYGNVYTARQLVQLVDRAYGRFSPDDVAWQREDGSTIDPFRPEIEPGGFRSVAEMQADREVHFAAVRTMLEELDVFVFTLGLTEAWRATSDGAMFPIAPGAAGGIVDTAGYAFVNFGADEVIADLEIFLTQLKAIAHTSASTKAMTRRPDVPLCLRRSAHPSEIRLATTAQRPMIRAKSERPCGRR